MSWLASCRGFIHRAFLIATCRLYFVFREKPLSYKNYDKTTSNKLTRCDARGDEAEAMNGSFQSVLTPAMKVRKKILLRAWQYLVMMASFSFQSILRSRPVMPSSLPVVSMLAWDLLSESSCEATRITKWQVVWAPSSTTGTPVRRTNECLESHSFIWCRPQHYFVVCAWWEFN